MMNQGITVRWRPAHEADGSVPRGPQHSQLVNPTPDFHFQGNGMKHEFKKAFCAVVIPRRLVLDGIFQRAAAFGRKLCRFSPVLGFASAPLNFPFVPNTLRLSAECRSVWKLPLGTTPFPCVKNGAKLHRNCGVFLVSGPCAGEHKRGIGPNSRFDNWLSKLASIFTCLGNKEVLET